MQINSTKPVAQKIQAPKAKPAEGQGQGQGNPPNQDSFQKSFMENPEIQRQLLSQVGSGGTLTIGQNENGDFQIKNDSPDFLTKLGRSGNKIMANASQEAVRLLEADPAFATKQIFDGLEGQIKNGFDRKTADALTPMMTGLMRSGMLIADVYKAKNTLRNKDASMVEKVVDVGHVVTDVVGLAGVVGTMTSAIPFLSNNASVLLGVSLAGDLAAAAFHAMGYVTERGQVNGSWTGKAEVLNTIWSSSAAKAADERATRAQKAAAKAAQFQS